MSFRGADPYGTPGGLDAADKPTDPPDERLAVGRTYIAYLRVNEPYAEVLRTSIEAITRILPQDVSTLVAIIVRDNGTIVDNNVTDMDAGNGLIVSQSAPGVVVIDIGNGQISTAMLADALITATKLANESVTTPALAAGAVDNLALGDLTVDTRVLADDAVTTAKIAPGAVDTAALGLLSVDTGALQAGSVTNAKLAADAVASGNIIDGTITGTDIAATTITGGNLVNDTITATQIAANAVGSSELADNAVDTAAIQNLAVTTGKLADAAVTAAKLAPGAGGTPWAKSITADSAAINNTTTETAFNQTIAIPANTLAVGDVIWLRAYGTTGVTGTPTLLIKLRQGSAAGTLIYGPGTGINAPNTPSTFGWAWHYVLVVRSIVGSSASCEVVAFGTNSANIQPKWDLSNAGAVTLDPTAIITFVVTATWNTAATADTTTMVMFNGVLIRPT